MKKKVLKLIVFTIFGKGCKPDPSENEDPEDAYHNQPLYKGAYGNLRFDLAKFLLESLN